jgi:hypothetical protein
MIFYDGPTPPDGKFDAFLNIPSISNDVGTKEWVDLIEPMPEDLPRFRYLDYSFLSDNGVSSIFPLAKGSHASFPVG